MGGERLERPFLFRQFFPQAAIGFILTLKRYRIVCKMHTKQPNAIKMKHEHCPSIRFSVFSSCTEPRIKNCVCVAPYSYKICVIRGPGGHGYLYLGPKPAFSVQRRPTFPTILPLFSPPSSVCLGGHILKFPQARFVVQSRFSSHLKDIVLRMVMRPSLFQLLHCSQ